MLDMCSHSVVLTPESQDRCDDLTERFEADWEPTPLPDFPKILGQALPEEQPLRTVLLIELAGADLEFRCDENLAVDVNRHYLQPFPELTTCRACLVELYKKEFHARHMSNPSLSAVEFLMELPGEYRKDLSTLIENGFKEQLKSHPALSVRDYVAKIPEEDRGDLSSLYEWEYQHLRQRDSALTVQEYLKQIPEQYRRRLLERFNPLKNFEYVLEEGAPKKLGRGGMGTVYLARQHSPRRDIALKLVSTELVSDELLKRFDYEIQYLGKLKHPGIATIYEAGKLVENNEEKSYLAMEYIEGRNLDEYVRNGRLKINDRLKLFLKLCDGVQHAHQQGIIHRDLKPANILVNEAGQPKVLDFGLAKNVDKKSASTIMNTESGHVLGTPLYMSPEQAAGKSNQTDVTTDVYTLGVILYEMLTGNLPYDVRKKPAHEIYRTICGVEATRPSKYDKRLRGDLDTIVLKALEKDKSRRYQSVTQLAADVERFLNHEPIKARRATWEYRALKFCRRNWLLVSGVTAVIVALAIGGALAGWQWSRAEGFAVSEKILRIKEQGQRKRAELAEKKERKLKVEAVDLAAKNANLATEKGKLAELEKKARERETALKIKAQNLAKSEREAKKTAQQEADKAILAAFRSRNTSAQEQINFGNVFQSLPYLISGLRLLEKSHEPKDRERLIQNTRIASALMQCPRIQHMWFHKKPVFHVEFSRDNDLVLTAGKKGAARVWNISTGKPIGPPLLLPGGVTCAAFSRDGFVATGCEHKFVVVRDPVGGRLAAKEIKMVQSVRHLAFSPTNSNHLLAVDGYQFANQEMGPDQVIPGAPMWLPGPQIPGPNGRMMPGPMRMIPGNPIRIPGITRNFHGFAKVWDVVKNETISRSNAGSWGNHGAFSPDGRVAVIGGASQNGGELSIWPIDSVDQKRCQAAGLIGGATGPLPGLLLLNSQQPKKRGYMGANSWVNFTAFSPDGKMVVTANGHPEGGVGDAMVWDVASRTPVAVLRHAKAVNRAVFNANGKRIVTASNDGTAMIWNAANGAPLVPALRHREGVTNAVFSRDGRFVLTCSRDGTARVWDAETGKGVTPYLPHNSPVLSGAFSPDCRRIVTGCQNGCVRVWSIVTVTGKTYRFASRGPCTYVKFNRRGKLIAIKGGRSSITYTVTFRGGQRRSIRIPLLFNREMRVLEPNNGKLDDPPLKHEGLYFTDVVSPLSDHFVTAEGGNAFSKVTTAARIRSFSSDKISTWQVPPKRQVRQTGFLSQKHGYFVIAPEFKPDPSGQSPQKKTFELHVVDLAAGKTVAATPSVAQQFLWAGKSENGGKTITTIGRPTDEPVQQNGSADLRLVRKLWKAGADGALEAVNETAIKLKRAGAVDHVAISDDGKLIVTVDSDSSFRARAWSAEDGSPISRPMNHSAKINFVGFGPKNYYLVTVSNDKTARIWDAGTGEPVTPPLVHQAPVLHAAFDTDGRRLATALEDGTVAVWIIPSGELPIDDCERIAELLSGSSFHDKGGLIPVDTAAWKALWVKHGETARLKYAAAEGQINEWHQIAAAHAKKNKNWKGMLIHLNTLIGKRPRRWLAHAGKNDPVGDFDWDKLSDSYAFRGYAWMQLKQWDKAAGDYSRALGILDDRQKMCAAWALQNLSAILSGKGRQEEANCVLQDRDRLLKSGDDIVFCKLGMFEDGDVNERRPAKKKTQIHIAKLDAGYHYRIDVKPDGFSAAFQFFDPEGKLVKGKITRGKNYESSLAISPAIGGTFRIEVSASRPRETGIYVVTVHRLAN